jgi:7-cyano-7-deazaguanine synthase
MSKALVILSGGQDSTTCLAIARQQFDEVHAVTFDYGQRHGIEIESAIAIGRAMNVASHEIISMGRILKGASPLVSDSQLGQYDSPEQLPGGVEPTFVPGRNLLFMVIAANRAAAITIRDLFTGLCEADFGGYYDCRQDFVDAMNTAIGEGFYGEPDYFTIHTPLMNLSKADSIKLAVETMGGHDFRRVFALTHTCYAGVKGGCGKCHACILRDRGFRDAGVDDPIWAHRLAVV